MLMPGKHQKIICSVVEIRARRSLRHRQIEQVSGTARLSAMDGPGADLPPALQPCENEHPYRGAKPVSGGPLPLALTASVPARNCQTVALHRAKPSSGGLAVGQRAPAVAGWAHTAPLPRHIEERRRYYRALLRFQGRHVFRPSWLQVYRMKAVQKTPHELRRPEARKIDAFGRTLAWVRADS